jgi:hypothetical protein
MVLTEALLFQLLLFLTHTVCHRHSGRDACGDLCGAALPSMVATGSLSTLATYQVPHVETIFCIDWINTHM